MDFTELATAPWLETLAPNGRGIWTIAGGRCAVGIVLLAARDKRFAIVRKSDVPGYEFSGQLALPGGLVRREHDATFAESLEHSLLARAEDEAGLPAAALEDLTLVSVRLAPVTRYMAKGTERFTLVLAARARLNAEVNLTHNRRSITEAFYSSPPLVWAAFAPANRLIIAQALGDAVPQRDRRENHDAILEALKFCNDAASAIRIPPIEDPWRSTA